MRRMLVTPSFSEVLRGIFCRTSKFRQFRRLRQRGKAKIQEQLDISLILSQLKKQSLITFGLTTGYQRKFCQLMQHDILEEFSTPTASQSDNELER